MTKAFEIDELVFVEKDGIPVGFRADGSLIKMPDGWEGVIVAVEKNGFYRVRNLDDGRIKSVHGSRLSRQSDEEE